MSKKSLFINGWPNSVRPLDEFIPDYKGKLIIVCTAKLAEDFIGNGWECFIVSSHSIEAYKSELLPKLGGVDIFSIISDSELHIQPAAYLREELNIPGQDLESADCFRNKYEMVKCLVNAKNFKVPLSYVATSKTAYDFKKTISSDKTYIIKPFYGTDSHKITKLSGENLIKDIDLYIDHYLIQNFIEFPVYHVDGLVTNGEMVFYSVSKYENTCLEYSKSESEILGSNIISDEKVIDLFGHAIKETLSLMPTPKNTTFHSEFFFDEDLMEIYFCEIGSRSPGGSGTLVKMIEYVYGINLPFEMVASNMPQYQFINEGSRHARNDGRTASTLFIPMNLVHSLPDVYPRNVIYFYGPNSNNSMSSGNFRSTDDAIKVVFTAEYHDLINQKQKILDLFS